MTSGAILNGLSKKELEIVRRQVELFEDRDRLHARVVRTLRRSRFLRRYTYDGKAAYDLLPEQLARLPGAEFRLLAAFVLAEEVPGLKEAEIIQWWNAIEAGE